MKLWALSDLHVGIGANRRAVEGISARPEDWLILAGDVGETPEHLVTTLELLRPRFQQLVWVPGNHELWTHPSDPCTLRGEARYRHLVELCRARGVLTPEDEFPVWRGEGGAHLLVPMFLHYDYGFRPDDVPAERAVEWAEEAGTLCQDEHFLHPAPHATAAAWCAARCDATAARLAALPRDLPWVLVNHNPLHRALCTLPWIPRFSIWCGTRRTEDWHRRFPAAVVVSGHLHIRSTRWLDGVRCEEVSLGYPNQRRREVTADAYLRQILPGPAAGAPRRDRWIR